MKVLIKTTMLELLIETVKHVFETLQFFGIVENAVTSRYPFEENAHSFYGDLSIYLRWIIKAK